MFMDGTIYAAVASNLSQGNGTLWEMKFSETLMNPFYEHPPLAIWMESIFHRLFVDSFLSERFYSLLVWFINGWLIIGIWKKLKPDSKIAWVPLFLWICIPMVAWSFSNNMLENTMGIFVSASVLFFLNGMKEKVVLWNILSGVMLTLAFLSKGFVGLFPFALPVIYILFFFKERAFTKHLLSGISMLLGFGISMLPFVLNEASYAFISTYFDHQVRNSVEHIQTVAHRFKILEYFILQTLIPLVIAVLVFFVMRNKLKLSDQNRNWSLLFIVLALCGVLPIMISLKQRDFYILTVYPFIAIAIALYMENGFERLHEKIAQRISKPTVIVIPMVVVAIGLSAVSTQFYKRDQELVMGVEKLAESQFAGQTLDCSNNIRYGWGTMAYLSRYAKISVWRDHPSAHKIMLVNEGEEGEALQFDGFKLVLRNH